MKTQKEYMNSIKAIFNEHVTANKSKLDAYSYCNSDAIYCFKDFISDVRTLGLEFSDVYHANGIGNNNEYKIYLEEIDKDGFFIQKKHSRVLLLYRNLRWLLCKPQRFCNRRKNSSRKSKLIMEVNKCRKF